MRLDLGRLRESHVGRLYGRANRSIEGTQTRERRRGITYS